MKTSAVITFCLLALVSNTACSAQSPSCDQTTFIATFTDEKNQPLAVSTSDIRVKIGEAVIAQESVKVVPLNVPPRTVIVLDMSGSMRERWDASIMSALGLVKASGPTVPIGLVAFNEKLATIPISVEHAEIEHELLAAQAIRPQGRSAVLDAIEFALRMLTPGRAGDVLFIVSDGADNHSRSKYRLLEQEIMRSRTRVFLVAPTSDGATDPEEIMGPADLIALAKESGGEIFRLDPTFPSKEPGRSKQMAEFLGVLNNRLYQKLLRPELIQVTIPSNSERNLNLRVEAVENGRFGKSMRVIAPTKIYPCTVKP